MGPVDLAIAVPILAFAGWLLQRSLRRGRGGCHGCSGGACGSRGGDGRPLVKLGGGARR